MIEWNKIYKYLRFEISFGETGLEEIEKNWDPNNGPIIPPHNPVLPGELIAGIDKFILREISLREFQSWSRIACSSLVSNIDEEGGWIKSPQADYEWLSSQIESMETLSGMEVDIDGNIHPFKDSR